MEAGFVHAEVENALHQLANELGFAGDRGDIIECVCCESRPNRKHIVDVLFQGMDLFLLKWHHESGRYRSHVKRYGCFEWELV